VKNFLYRGCAYYLMLVGVAVATHNFWGANWTTATALIVCAYTAAYVMGKL
jgi:hypothetical protein